MSFPYIIRDTAAVLANANDVLPTNALAFETDTGQAKLGDGLTRYKALGYFDPNGAATLAALGLKADVSPLIRTITAATDTITQADNGKILRLFRATAQTLTPTGPFAASFNCLLIQVGAGQATIAAGASGTTLRVPPSGFTNSAGQYAQFSLVAEGADSLVLGGDLA